MMNEWTLAIETLSWIEKEGLSIPPALTRTVNQLKIRDKRKISLAKTLVTETLRRRNFIDRIIDTALAPASPHDFDLGVQAFLRLYVYKTKFKVYDLTKAMKYAKIGRLVLGWKTVMPIEEALGKILALDPTSLLTNLSNLEQLSLQSFHPMWFVKYSIRLLGRSQALQLLKKTSDKPTYLLGVNVLKATVENVLSNLAKYGIILEKIEEHPLLFKFDNNLQLLTTLKEYWKGMFFLQDPTSALAVLSETPKPGSIVYDVGATHGAKSIYIALLMGKGQIISIDFPSRHLRILENRLDTLGIQNVEILAAKVDESLPLNKKADLVYLSPPSSGSGTLWRIASKWRELNAVKQMCRIQWNMLNLCAAYVREDGFLVYSTPSILIEENEMMIERFLKWHPEFILANIELKMGVSGLRGQEEAIRLYPHIHNVDGFYIVKLVRTKD